MTVGKDAKDKGKDAAPPVPPPAPVPAPPTLPAPTTPPASGGDEALKAQLAELTARLEASEKKNKEHEDAQLSEQERLKKQLAETQAQLALSQRQAAMAAAGLPVELASETDPIKIAEILKATKAAGVPGAPVGAPINPGDAGGATPPASPGDGKGADPNSDANKPTSDQAWDQAWRKRAGVKD